MTLYIDWLLWLVLFILIKINCLGWSRSHNFLVIGWLLLFFAKWPPWLLFLLLSLLLVAIIFLFVPEPSLLLFLFSLILVFCIFILGPKPWFLLVFFIVFLNRIFFLASEPRFILMAILLWSTIFQTRVSDSWPIVP